jgi:hypothetical protein
MRPNSTLLTGEAYGDQLYVQIHLPWSTLIIVVPVLGSIVLATTPLLTRKSRELIVKSSPLPFILKSPSGIKETVWLSTKVHAKREEMLAYMNTGHSK